MGPFPHDAPKAVISPDNPAGTDGFAFVEFTHPEPQYLRDLFADMGFSLAARHRSRAVELWRQGDITFVVNADPQSLAARFGEAHGPSAPSMGWRVVDAAHAAAHAVEMGAEPCTDPGRTFDVPAIRGIGGSLIYFIDDKAGGAFADDAFEWVGETHPEGFGFYHIDHLTHNVFKGNMDRWFAFYRRLFNFREIRFFNIEGRHTGLFSRALTSPCGKIRIPINEDRDEKGQIVAYLKKYRGEGIQHVALGARDIYAATDAVADRGIRFMPPPPPSYYAMSHERVKDHGEPVERMQRHGILIDGEGVVEGGETRLLLQIFTKTVIGPIFFEFIQRKGDEGFGEGNFKALFEAIEREQILSGELADEPVT